jgi:peptidoglycan/xylan/chitin deacetylase (PgdA/CDA1 family)
MSTKVTVVMYHYVRDLQHSRYPEIKGLDIAAFKEQIEYLERHYTFITMEMLIESIESKKPLPEKSVLLTFDDAYIDHFIHVFPLLNLKKIQGSFFPPVRAITENKILDVNKIHFILSSSPDKKNIVKEIFRLMDAYRKEFNLEDNEYYYKKLAIANRFDPAEVIFIKRLLQTELNESLRNKITDVLFTKFVGIQEESFSRELYMNPDQLKCMKANGMHIGSHGFDHYWLGSLSKEKQTSEIEKSLDFLKEINGSIDSWTMCYPYGNYNNDTLEILADTKCKLAVTTEVTIADTSVHNRYTIPRLDTNDFPKDRNAPINKWYELA